MHDYADVLRFWFEELQPSDWWKKDDELDEHIAKRFMNVHQAAAACELYYWRSEPLGRVAEIIVLDQFSRNIHRGLPLSFANDPVALALAQEAVAAGADREVEAPKRTFIYMPYMHSESPLIHQVALRLFEDLGDPLNLDYEIQHKLIIDRFGRYPHRNAILGRLSTPEELEFLQQPNSSF